MSITIMTGSKVLVAFDTGLTTSVSSNWNANFKITDGKGTATYCANLSIKPRNDTTVVNVSLHRVVTGLIPGSNTFKVQWKSNILLGPAISSPGLNATRQLSVVLLN
jgi:hypothetical protein